MKKLLGIALGLLVIAVLAYFAFFWKEPAQPQKLASTVPTVPDEQEPKQMIETDKLKTLELINDKGAVKFEKDAAGKWIMAEPERDEVGNPLFSGLMGQLAKTGPAGYIPKKEQEPPAQYGLDPAAFTLKFEYDDGRKRVLKIGKYNPSGDYLYANFEGEQDLILIPADIHLFLINDRDYYRFRRLIGINSENISELKLVVSDPKLRAELGVPEVRRMMVQTVPQGKAWVYLEPYQEPAGNGPITSMLAYLGKSGRAAEIKDISKADLAAWQLNPPRAYFEMTYPDHKEKILVGKEQNKLIYLFQEEKMAVLGFPEDQVLTLLAGEYRITTLIPSSEFRVYTRIETSFPSSGSPGYVLQELGEHTWSVAGNAEQKFPRARIKWMTDFFISNQVAGYVNERPVPAALGLQKPRVDLKFYSSAGLEHDIQIGKWDKENQKCYVYDAAKDKLVWYAHDVTEWIPPSAEKFLIKAQPPKVK